MGTTDAEEHLMLTGSSLQIKLLNKSKAKNQAKQWRICIRLEAPKAMGSPNMLLSHSISSDTHDISVSN